MRLGDMFQSVIVRPLRRVADVLFSNTPEKAPPEAKPVWTEPPVPKADIPMMRMSPGKPGTVAPWETRTTPPLGSKPHVDPVVAKAVKDPSEVEIARAQLVPVDESNRLAGVTQKMIVQDAHTGRRYVFKQPEEKTQALEREQLALSLRRAAGQPSVAVAAQRVTLSDGEVVHGYVKPFVESQGALPNDPRQWTEKQKSAVLVDHLWAELTGNYDTKPLQYVVCGDGALNIDWDHAGKDLERNPWASWGVLDRHKAGAVVPAAQRLLLSSYVRGELTLDTAPLYAALREIEKLARADFERAVTPLMDATLAQGKKLGPFETKEQLVEHMLHRQQTLRPRFGEMLRRTENERAEWRAREAKPTARSPLEQRLLFSFGEAQLTVLTLAMNTPIFDVSYQVSQKWQAFRSAHVRRTDA